MISDTSEDFAQVILGIEPVQFRDFGQGEDRRGALPAGIRAREHPVSASESHRPHRAFGGVVVDADAAIAQHQGQCIPTRQSVTDRLGHLAPAGDPRQCRVQPFPEIGEQLLTPFRADLQPDFGGLAADRRLDRVQCRDPLHAPPTPEAISSRRGCRRISAERAPCRRLR